MGKLVFILLFSIVFNRTFACHKKVDPKRVVLFIDTNASYYEAKAAKEAACERGETFKVLPYNMKVLKELGTTLHEKTYYNKVYANKCRTEQQSESNHCTKLIEKIVNIEEKYNDLFRKNYHRSDKVSAILSTQLTSYAKNNIAITSIAASGHNGGGHINGETASIDKYKISTLYNDAYQDKPELAAQLNSLLLWGCYTATPNEVSYWKSTLPQLKMVAGFHGSGPSNLQESSWKFMKDFLIKEKGLSKISNSNQLRQSVLGISGLTNTNAGLYAESSCGDYYYSRGVERGQVESQFSLLEERIDCGNYDTRTDLIDITNIFNSYYQGYKQIPKDTSSGALRVLYNRIRALEQCIDEDAHYNGNSAGLLLFYDSVAINFDKVFKNLIVNGFNELDNLNKEIKLLYKEEKNKISDNLDWIDRIGDFFSEEDLVSSKNYKELAEIESFEKTLFRVNKNIASLKKGKSFSKIETSKETPTQRSKIAQFLGDMDEIKKHPFYKRSKKLRSKIKNLIDLSNKVDTYLYRLDQNCMDWLEWHIVIDGQSPKPKCN